jgi:hypothetical protein
MEGNLLRVTATGEWNAVDHGKAMEKAARLVESKGVVRVIYDIRRATGEASTTEIFDVSSSVALGPPATVRQAVVYSPDCLEPEEVRFAENVAANRAIQMRLFTKIEDAMAWLAGTG